MKRLLPLLLMACNNSPEVSLEIRLPDDKRLLQAVTRVNLIADRNGVILSQSSFPATATTVSLDTVSHGADTVFTLEGVDTSDAIIARGQTCPIDFEGGGMVAPLYFAPSNFFAPTPGAPSQLRENAIAAALDDGTVLLAGGADVNGDVLGSAELFSPSTGTFSPLTATLMSPRWRAQAVAVPSVGTLITGGLDANGATLADGEVYIDTQAQFLPVSSPLLDARVGHRAQLLSDNRVLISGGSATNDGVPLGTTVLVYTLIDGNNQLSYQISAGPPLSEARREHAVTVALSVPVVFGGYGSGGQPLDSIEALDVNGTVAQAPIAHLQTARAEATASLLGDGSILLVGGIGPTGAPLATAELFNPVTRSTTSYDMESARRGHTATVLDDGSVLVAGGIDDTGNATADVELFVPGLGFLTERPLSAARDHHDAVPLCDGTVLIVGGAAAAEIYTEPAN